MLLIWGYITSRIDYRGRPADADGPKMKGEFLNISFKFKQKKSIELKDHIFNIVDSNFKLLCIFFIIKQVFNIIDLHLPCSSSKFIKILPFFKS